MSRPKFYVRWLLSASAPNYPLSAEHGVASALATAATKNSNLATNVPTWLCDRLTKLDLNAGPVRNYLQRLLGQATPRSKAILASTDRLADALHLDHDLLVDRWRI